MPAIVLSASRQESAKFIAQEGLGSAARHIVNKDTVPAPASVSVIHVLPSYPDRRDFHAVESALRHLRRKAHNLETIEWVRLPDGSWRKIALGDVADVEPPVNPRSKSTERRLAVVAEADTSKDAVPGQISVEEVIHETQVEQLAAVAAAAPDPQVDVESADEEIVVPDAGPAFPWDVS